MSKDKCSICGVEYDIVNPRCTINIYPSQSCNNASTSCPNGHTMNLYFAWENMGYYTRQTIAPVVYHRDAPIEVVRQAYRARADQRLRDAATNDDVRRLYDSIRHFERTGTLD